MTGNTPERSSCCGSTAERPGSGKGARAGGGVPAWIRGTLSTPAGDIPAVSRRLTGRDIIGAWKVRWGIGRMRYRVKPGLYALGNPTPESPVLVTANYKLTFDALRSSVESLDAWILVLATAGINVWCAAGKGTFGTAGLVRRIALTGLEKVVSHRTLIVPQLGAPGISAHEAKKLSGFRVVYGPVRAEDIPAFIENGMRATPEMRRVRFSLRDRIVLIPMELVAAVKWGALAASGMVVLAELLAAGFSPVRTMREGVADALVLLGGCAAGSILPPVLFPWLPGRAFSLKGLWVGIVYFLAIAGCSVLCCPVIGNAMEAAGWLLMLAALASFLAMNFTGATPFTSLSGVEKELKTALPVQIFAGSAGFVVWIASLFL